MKSEALFSMMWHVRYIIKLTKDPCSIVREPPSKATQPLRLAVKTITQNLLTTEITLQHAIHEYIHNIQMRLI